MTRSLLRQGLDSHLSKSEVSRLADWGTALGFRLKLLSKLEELGFPNDSLWAEFGWGRSSDSFNCHAP